MSLLFNVQCCWLLLLCCTNLSLLQSAIVNSATSDRPTLEQVLIQLRTSPPHTANDFLAALVGHHFQVGPKLAKLSPLVKEQHDDELQPQIERSHEVNSVVFRQYVTEGDDRTNRSVRIVSSGQTKPATTATKRRDQSSAMLQDIPPSANCEPELQTINLSHLVNKMQDRTPKKRISFSSVSQSDIYFPHCIRLPKCGGCCPSERLRCMAKNATTQNITVMHMRYSTSQRRFQLVGLKRVQVDRHASCACECITQPDDCERGQLYRQDECRCICPGGHKLACLARQRSATNVLSRYINWNAARCKCECTPPGGVWRCSSGFKFDPFTCSCKRTMAGNASFNAVRNSNNSQSSS